MLYIVASPNSSEHSVGIYSNVNGTMTSKSGSKTTLYVDSTRTMSSSLSIRWEEWRDISSSLHIPTKGSGTCMSRYDKDYPSAYELYFSTLAHFSQADCFQTCKKKIVTGCMLQTCMSWLVAMPAPIPIIQRKRPWRLSSHYDWHAMAPNEMIYQDNQLSSKSMVTQEQNTNFYGILQDDSSDE